MANSLDRRRRIKSAQNISKTTRAMQMIAASKLKRAQDAAVSSRPYVTELMKLARSISPKNEKKEEVHPKTLYVFIGPDKGLCGGLVTNLIRELVKVKGADAQFVSVGKKLEGPVASSKKLLASFPFGTTLPQFSQVLPVIDIIKKEYEAGNVDKVCIVSTKFISVFSQIPQTTNLLPIRLDQTVIANGVKQSQANDAIQNSLFEPSKEALLPELTKRYIEMTVFQQFLESYASYNAAQMIAMQNATNNAKDIVSELQLLYNKARQEKITNEILDISSASVALGTL